MLRIRLHGLGSGKVGDCVVSNRSGALAGATHI